MRVRAGMALIASALIATTLLVASPARSAEGLYLNWNDCALGSAARSDFTRPCTDAGEQSLYCAFTLGQPLDSVVAVEIVVDVQVAGDSIPPWWQYAPGACRYGALTTTADFSQDVACTDFWSGLATAGGPPAIYATRQPRGGRNQARIVITFSLPSENYRTLNATDMYYAGRLTFHQDRTSSCSGCALPACLVLNSILVGRISGVALGSDCHPGSVSGSVCLVTPGPGNANHATWQGAGADCSAVPVRARTWGQLKSMYR